MWIEGRTDKETKGTDRRMKIKTGLPFVLAGDDPPRGVCGRLANGVSIKTDLASGLCLPRLSAGRRDNERGGVRGDDADVEKSGEKRSAWEKLKHHTCPDIQCEILPRALV